MYKKIHLIVLDSVGIGEAPDAAEFGDVGTHTLKHTLEAHPNTLPNLSKLGLGNIDKLPGVDEEDSTTGFYTKIQRNDTHSDRW